MSKLFVCLGVVLLLFPIVGNQLNHKQTAKVINEYKMSLTHVSDRLMEAQSYNEALFQDGFAVDYDSTLAVTENGVMGYIEIPKIDVVLPIFHGTDDADMQLGVGHLRSSSLPIGGPSTHSVLIGHSGLPSARLFTDLDQLQPGDTFTLYVLNQALEYEVEKVLTVLPEEVNNLEIVEGEDHCTLVTCTPYGVNTHRLLIYGTRR